MAVTPRSAFAAAALFCILQATTAQSCRANSYFVGNTSSNGSSGLCVCNRGYACTTCSSESTQAATDVTDCLSHAALCTAASASRRRVLEVCGKKYASKLKVGTLVIR